jgi:hypothetical protein
VADSDNHRIQILSTAGKYLRSIHLHGDVFDQQLNAVALDPAGMRLVIVDDHQIEKLKPSGKVLARWGGT